MQLPDSFDRALEAGLERRRLQNQYFKLQPPASQLGLVDFGSNDSLNIRSSDVARQKLLDSLRMKPSFWLGAGGSRILDGSGRETAELEQYLSEYHGGDAALLFNSGYEANVAIFGNLPQKGDAIIHDEKLHASMREGIRSGSASIIRSFRHNDVRYLADQIEATKSLSPDILQGNKTLFVVFESFYSMDGDIAPVQEILDTVRTALPAGNAVFMIDEAHSTGLIGPEGAGYIRHLGLEKEGIIQMHSYAKAAGGLGAAIICHPKVKEFLVNYARSLIYSTGPSFPMIATIHACVDTLRSTEGQRRRELLKARLYDFYQYLAVHPHWERVRQSGVLAIPGEGSNKPLKFRIPIIPLITRTGLCKDLQQTLLDAGYLTHALHYPVVPRTSERIRLMIHASNASKDVRKLVSTIVKWGVKKDGAAAQALI